MSTRRRKGARNSKSAKPVTTAVPSTASPDTPKIDAVVPAQNAGDDIYTKKKSETIENDSDTPQAESALPAQDAGNATHTQKKSENDINTPMEKAPLPAFDMGVANNTPLFNLPQAGSAWMQPKLLTSPAPWAGHIPFAAWLIAATRPRTLVELGVYSGISYLAFCQSARESGVPLRAWGVDTWEGDAHAGHYGDAVLQALRAQHDAPYGRFSTLLQKTFDEALADIEDASIDVLHIDGLHTYDAVRHDFESWRGKLSEHGVVLFHDTAVREGDFGVWRFWQEVRERWPSFAFEHSSGLGVLLVGAKPPKALLALAEDSVRWPRVRAAFATLGSRFELQAQLLHTTTMLADEQARSQERLAWIDAQDGKLREIELENERSRALLAQQGAHIDTQNAQLRALGIEAERSRSIVAQQSQHIDTQNAQLRALGIEAERSRSIVAQQSQHIVQLDRHIAVLGRENLARQQHIDALLASRSWRYAAWLRWCGRQVRRVLATPAGRMALTLALRARGAVRYALRGDWAGLAARARQLMRQCRDERSLQRLQAASAAAASAEGSAALRCGVLCTPHTRYVAHAVQAALRRAGFEPQLLTAPAADEQWPLAFYVVICPQMFSCLPPGEKRIAFQMEQTVSSRWFTASYLGVLENSLAVLDYAPANLEALASMGIIYPHVYLAPIGGVVDYPAQLGYAGGLPEADAQCEVLFYGDASAPRRQKLLEAVGKRFKLRVVREVFGQELHRALAGAKVVLNIHYYEGALLETTRVYECLSLGVPVVSETAADQKEHAALEGVVHFATCDDEAALLAALDAALRQHSDAAAHAAWQEKCRAHIAASQQHFDFMLHRLLLARRLLDWPRFEKLTASGAPLAARMALSLPETFQRRAAFEAVRPADVQLFDGLRATPGWQGAALSYKYLATRAVQQALPRLEVMEDDVLFAENYAARRTRILAWLDAHEGQWDIFQGTMALLHPDTRVLHAERTPDGDTFLIIDRPMSMVCNIYAPAALARIAAWDESNKDADTNTIDRWLQAAGLRAVLTLPFLVQHREDQNSSLWGISNEGYSQMIAQTEAELAHMADEWLAGSGKKNAPSNAQQGV